MDANLKEEWAKETLGSLAEFCDRKPPFKLHIFPNFLDDDIVSQLRDDIISSIKFKNKDNDLYKFKQSKDFKTEIPAKKLSPALHDFIDLMLGSVKDHLEKKTGKVLSGKNFDITASRYDFGDYLLCHNDDIKDDIKKHSRSFAFIYYLTKRQWNIEDGGALTLYDVDTTGEPISINNRILPRPNTLIIFPTTPTSWHSVQEVIAKDDVRLSINGWFNSDILGKVSDDFDLKILELYPHEFLRPIVLDERLEKFFKECLNQEYLMAKTCLMIKKRFKKESEINLTDFLVKDKYKEISEALKHATSEEENLVHVGPYNKRNYKILKLDKLPPICRDLFDAFRSELFFLLLSKLTGLDLQPPSLKQSSEEKGEEKVDGEEESSDDEESDDEDDDSESDEDDDDEEESDDEAEDDEDNKKIIGDRESKELKEESRVTGGSSSSLKEVEQVKEKGDNSEIDESKSSKRGAERLHMELKEELGKSPRKRKKVSDPMARFEFRHFEHGSYTLIHDHGYELGEKSALDVILHFNHDFEVDFNEGGYITYLDVVTDIDPDDSNYELLTIEPKSNCLSLVYRCDEGTCRFLKHINKSHKGNYQDLSCVYYERPSDTIQFSRASEGDCAPGKSGV